MAMTLITFFVTPHGFGHASRAAAVMAAVSASIAEVQFEIVTTSPQWLFTDVVPAPCRFQSVNVDLGMVQTSPLTADLSATCLRLNGLLPFEKAMVDALAERLVNSGCRLVVCDIAALVIAAAVKAGLPSVLVENFTWDWVYKAFAARHPALQKHIDYLGSLYARADLHVQTEPLCRPLARAVKVGPIARRPKSCAGKVRCALGIADHHKMILVSMGGIADRFGFLERLSVPGDCRIVIAGADPLEKKAPNNVVLLPTRSRFLHPDLLQAADVLIGKAGYSTIAEAYFAGIPFGYVARTDSPESRPLETFIKDNLPSVAISTADYASGAWAERLWDLLAMPRAVPSGENGADTVARLIKRFVDRL